MDDVQVLGRMDTEGFLSTRPAARRLGTDEQNTCWFRRTPNFTQEGAVGRHLAAQCVPVAVARQPCAQAVLALRRDWPHTSRE